MSSDDYTERMISRLKQKKAQPDSIKNGATFLGFDRESPAPGSVTICYELPDGTTKRESVQDVQSWSYTDPLAVLYEYLDLEKNGAEGQFLPLRSVSDSPALDWEVIRTNVDPAVFPDGPTVIEHHSDGDSVNENENPIEYVRQALTPHGWMVEYQKSEQTVNGKPQYEVVITSQRSSNESRSEEK
jgi:hypothetical protein